MSVASHLKIATKEGAEETSRLCAELVGRARAEGCWLYDPEGKQWYPPEHFEHVFGQYLIQKYATWFMQVQVLNPIEAIEKGWQRVQKLQRSIMLLTGKVLQQGMKKYK